MEVQSEPSSTRRAVIFTVVLMLIIAVIAVGGVYLWQRAQVSRLEDELATARSQAAEAQGKVTDVQKEVTGLEEKLRSARRLAKKTEQDLREQRKQTKDAKQEKRQAEERAGDLPDGRYYGSLKEVAGGDQLIKVDLKEFLTGNKAERAAREDGEIKKDEKLDTDYYIRNESSQVRSMDVAGGAQVKILDKGTSKTRTVNFEDFARIYNDPTADQKHVSQNNYWIWVKSGKVVRMEEQYLA
ncbi:MAG: hypothetical protein WD004_07875 [Actinomycetota bacterium]